MRMRYSRHFNIGPANSPEGSCELVKWSLSNDESN